MAARYWVGGAGTWNASTTTNWSATSGGAGGASAPTTADDVFIDANSGSGVISIATGATCLNSTINNANVELSLQDNFVQTGFVTFTFGTITLNSFSFTATRLISTVDNNRTLNFGTGKFILSGNNAAILNFSPVVNLTVSGSRNIELSYTGATGTRSFAPASVAAGNSESKVFNLKFLGGVDVLSFNSARAHGTIDFDGFAGTCNNTSFIVFGDFKISSGMTLTGGTGLITMSATSGTKTITTNGKTIDQPITFDGVGGTFQLQDNCTVGSTRTVTLTNGALDLNSNTLSCGIFSSSNSNTRSIAFGTGKINITGSGATVWTTSTVTNLTNTGSRSVEFSYSGSTGTRLLNVGLYSESNAINVSIVNGSDTVSFGNAYMNNLDTTGFSGTLTNNTRRIYGNMTLSSTTVFGSGTGTTTFASTSGTKTITTSGLTLDCPFTFDGIGGTWSFADALTQGSTRAFTITNGTVKLKAGATSTVGAFATSGSNQKYLQSTTAGSQATLSQASGTVTVSYLSIKDIAATGGATWNAYVDYNNVDQGDNTGWDFSYSPAIDNEFPVALRSFTQPKRF